MDRFPDAFRRMEKVVDIGKIKTFPPLHSVARSYFGPKWKDTPGQMPALAIEARKRGIPAPVYYRRMSSVLAPSWRHETVTVRGKGEGRYRDLKTGRFIKRP